MLFNKINSFTGRALLLVWAVLGLAAGSSCSKEETSPTTERPAAPDTHLVSSTLIGEYSTAALAGRVPDIPLAGALVRYPIRVYKLTYTTRTPGGQPVTASGALLVPVTTQALPLLSYQHGTIRPDDEDRAPSYYKSSSEVYSAVSVLASTGYIVAAPDYIGYGASKAQPHPYEHASSLASASLDMLRAAKEFCRKENAPLNQKNYLLGYSEGGFATMALHKLMEEQAASEFTVTASAPGAGAYHKSAFASYILNSTQPLNFLSSYVWVLDTYNRVYGINRPYTYYFNQPWAGQLQANPFGEVPTQASELFAGPFRAGVLNQSDTQLLAAFRDNDIYDWKPRAPLALFHGTADDYVPYFNSQDAYNAMRARGATQVELRPIPGGTHFSSVATYTLSALAFISQC
ncbi:alpha/beta hydrolase family protein [Hymenobacter psychrotolerans]|uniref:Lysophospholipase, alpha-beta hydrolase superfamily n=1 Tax=Hymenobacter psychrotolerans DSM 18569 TaxID=1121959 RepID=A0A1M6PGZ5_9BACT|nr:alpha/beta fold hydrolase [Hymenobacter psychrotolerans]SHK07225.1 Lysophospholipase, alpha-beta hydrolase superfamily [Hymenobacter psychrotolerans DSM 18569]